MNDDTLNEGEGMGILDRIKESPRTISALIIILVVAAAIYAFSGDDTSEQVASVGEETAMVAEEAEGEAMEEGSEGLVAAGVTDGEPTIEEQVAALPQAERTGEGYNEVAQTGDGYTHLARRAATRWLSENQAGYAVTDEHRVYIEDYIQNRMGSDGLELGARHTISFDLISEAVMAAGELSETQLENLSQYTHVFS